MKKTLITIGGLGAEKHDRTEGLFEVRYSETKVFSRLSEAFNFYHKLNYPASLYDRTDSPVCLEMKVYSEFGLPSDTLKN